MGWNAHWETLHPHIPFKIVGSKTRGLNESSFQEIPSPFLPGRREVPFRMISPLLLLPADVIARKKREGKFFLGNLPFLLVVAHCGQGKGKRNCSGQLPPSLKWGSCLRRKEGRDVSSREISPIMQRPEIAGFQFEVWPMGHHWSQSELSFFGLCSTSVENPKQKSSLLLLDKKFTDTVRNPPQN